MKIIIKNIQRIQSKEKGVIIQKVKMRVRVILNMGGIIIKILKEISKVIYGLKKIMSQNSETPKYFCIEKLKPGVS